MTALDVRKALVKALHQDLLGPNEDEEELESPPSRWYLTGFLAPTGQSLEDRTDPTSDEELDAAVDGDEPNEREAGPARKPIFPSSFGLSVLVRDETQQLEIVVRFGTYAPVEDADPEASDTKTVTARSHWKRTPHEHTVTVSLREGATRNVDLAGSGAFLTVHLRPLAEAELPLVPAGTRYVTIFLVNHRTAYQRPETDRGFLFQTSIEVQCSEGFLHRPNLRGARKSDDFDDRVGDVQHRDCYEYAVGHGISTTAEVTGKGTPEVYCGRVESTWIPSAEVERVAPREFSNFTLSMDELSKLTSGKQVRPALENLVKQYSAWISQQQWGLVVPEGASQAEKEMFEARKDTSDTLLQEAKRACARMQYGIELLERESLALEAFALANKVMSRSAKQRAAAEGKTVEPAWRPFQLAFLLMNLRAQWDPTCDERDEVELIFFPTGGGKTEAYLGLAAFTLLLRRMRDPTVTSAGVTILMRYTLRLLTLDQLDRAATLICALELERLSAPERLGPRRFSIGLWVGRGATPNRLGAPDDKDEFTAYARVIAHQDEKRKGPAPIPIDRCPWCGEALTPKSFALNDDVKTVGVQHLRLFCSDPSMLCPFGSEGEAKTGLPLLAVDEEIYCELPCFLIATLDKFASLPWVGETGALLGRSITHYNERGFYGPTGKPFDAKLLPKPLHPPELIIQDELHLLSGPLGTLAGLYESVLEYLSTDTKKVRPKIVASTATVRRAHAQIRALFARTRVSVFPPPGPSRRDSFFAEMRPTKQEPGRLYVGIAAPGRSLKVLLMRVYLALLGAAQKQFERPAARVDTDPYMTLVGYFNSLRELGGSRRIVEDEVRARLLRASRRKSVGAKESVLADRTIAFECVELTSRETTDNVKVAKERLRVPFAKAPKGATKKPKGATSVRKPVDVALASNMISVGLDLQRLGLMVVCGQPKTAAEYIQATSRVGRDVARPGLVVTLLNAYRPRDRSHYEHFESFHEAFYRAVEATSVTPFSARALDRGLAALVVALARLGDPELTPSEQAKALPMVRERLQFIEETLCSRVERHREGRPEDEPMEELQAQLKRRVKSLLDAWQKIAQDDPGGEGLSYQPHEGGRKEKPKRVLLHMPQAPELAGLNALQRQFVANRSLRDVEATADVYVTEIDKE